MVTLAIGAETTGTFTRTHFSVIGIASSPGHVQTWTSAHGIAMSILDKAMKEHSCGHLLNMRVRGVVIGFNMIGRTL